MVHGSGKEDRRRVAHHDDLPEEKWIVAFRNPNSKSHPQGSTKLRQFYAAGFYEAYDLVVSYAERTNQEILWFKEKRLCEPFANRNFPGLESVCTYCNRKYNHQEPIPCIDGNCTAEFCSRDCQLDHNAMRHRK